MSTYSKDLEEKIDILEAYQRKFREIREKMHILIGSSEFKRVEKEYDNLEKKLWKEFNITPNKIVETSQMYEKEWLQKIMYPEAQAPTTSFIERYEQAVEQCKQAPDKGNDKHERDQKRER